METDVNCSERSVNDSQVNSKDIRSLVNLIKVLKGRELFLILQSPTGIKPLEASKQIFTGESESYLEGILKLSNYLVKHNVMLNEVHGDSLYKLSEKFPITKNIFHPMLEHKKKTLDYSLKISEEIQIEKEFISHLIESNKRWCSLEREFNESLNVHQHQTQNTNSSEQAKLQAKKMKKLRLLKEGYEIIWRIMSIHKINYREEEEFRKIFYRINKTQNLSILNISEICS